MLTLFDSSYRPQPANEVYVTGSFDNWTQRVKLDKSDDTFRKEVELAKVDEKIRYKVYFDDISFRTTPYLIFWMSGSSIAPPPALYHCFAERRMAASRVGIRHFNLIYIKTPPGISISSRWLPAYEYWTRDCGLPSILSAEAATFWLPTSHGECDGGACLASQNDMWNLRNILHRP